MVAWKFEGVCRSRVLCHHYNVLRRRNLFLSQDLLIDVGREEPMQ